MVVLSTIPKHGIAR